MYPVLFRIGDFEITSFGVMVGIAALVGIRLFGRELARSRLPDEAVNAAIGGVIGGLVGAKVLWAIEFSGSQPVGELLFSRGGLSWFGGLLGGVGTGLWLLRRYRVPLVRGLAAATPALAVGHAIGRIGCFLVGDDYGRPTTLPWGVAFPEGLPPTDVPVHPTQLYEAGALAVVAWLLFRWRRRGVPDAIVLGRYLVLAGATRFAIEFIRVNLRVLGPFTVAQLIALALVLVGMVLVARAGRSRVATLAVLMAALAATGVRAHHSFAADYDVRKPITLTGTVTRAEWTNPHVHFFLKVTDAAGAVTEWQLEMGAVNGLLRRGWTRSMLVPGDVVTVNGYQARDGSRLANARLVTLRDGRKMSGGTLPDAPAN